MKVGKLEGTARASRPQDPNIKTKEWDECPGPFALPGFYGVKS